MQSQLWVRVAQTGDAGVTVRTTSTATTRMTAQVLAYSGTHAVQPVAAAASTAEARKSAAHTTPVVTASPSDPLTSSAPRQLVIRADDDMVKRRRTLLNHSRWSPVRTPVGSRPEARASA